MLAVPPGVVTATFPELPLATTAVILTGLTMENELAGVPPKLTAVAPENPVPVIVIVVPVEAVAGVNELMVGKGIKVKPLRLAVPPGVITETFPLFPFPTIAFILEALVTVNEEAATPPNITELAPVNSEPVIVTVVPAGAAAGLKEVITGGAR